PALAASRPEVSAALKSDGSAPQGLAGIRALAGRSTLVVAEVALALVLLVGAGLMIKSFGRLLARQSGIDPENVLTLRLNLPSGPYKSQTATAAFQDLEERIAGLPGVQSVGVGDCPPVTGRCNTTLLWFRDRPEAPRGSEPSVGIHWVAGDYFKTLRIPLLRGRWFTPQDRQGAPKVVLISEYAARKLWPGEDPIGKPIGLGVGGFNDRAEIVGTVGNVRHGGLDETPVPDFYIPYAQSPQNYGTIFVRTGGNPLAMAAAARREIRAFNKDLPVYDIKSMRERISDSTARMRFSATLLGAFAAIALILAAVGIYGVMSYAVTQRTREIGIRIALGAAPGDVLLLVVQRGLALTLAGIGIGLVAALAATRVLQTLLYEVRPSDPATYAIYAVALAAVALTASFVPARRATRVDPLIALRAE
ncbi:MAG TPA: ABC transporter permease, partial [Bryobacterales bacterium]|nr:ABC transporter permease [Bryobacterales bacterium]